jgi:hypothetical protein
VYDARKTGTDLGGSSTSKYSVEQVGVEKTHDIDTQHPVLAQLLQKRLRLGDVLFFQYLVIYGQAPDYCHYCTVNAIKKGLRRASRLRKKVEERHSEDLTSLGGPL